MSVDVERARLRDAQAGRRRAARASPRRAAAAARARASSRGDSVRCARAAGRASAPRPGGTRRRRRARAAAPCGFFGPRIAAAGLPASTPRLTRNRQNARTLDSLRPIVAAPLSPNSAASWLRTSMRREPRERQRRLPRFSRRCARSARDVAQVDLDRARRVAALDREVAARTRRARRPSPRAEDPPGARPPARICLPEDAGGRRHDDLLDGDARPRDDRDQEARDISGFIILLRSKPGPVVPDRRVGRAGQAAR